MIGTISQYTVEWIGIFTQSDIEKGVWRGNQLPSEPSNTLNKQRFWPCVFFHTMAVLVRDR